jgi:hypothetical protein
MDGRKTRKKKSLFFGGECEPCQARAPTHPLALIFCQALFFDIFRQYSFNQFILISFRKTDYFLSRQEDSPAMLRSLA